jgi:hypothetical protein
MEDALGMFQITMEYIYDAIIIIMLASHSLATRCQTVPRSELRTEIQIHPGRCVRQVLKKMLAILVSWLIARLACKSQAAGLIPAGANLILTG